MRMPHRAEPAAAAAGRGPFGLTRGAIAAIATLFSVGIAVSLVPPLLSLNLAARGVSERTIGLLVACVAIAALAATPATSSIAARLGAAHVIAASTLVAAVLIPTIWLIESTMVLLPVVLAYGAAVTLCFTLAEYWINAATPDERRGLVMGIYATVLSLGFATGPAIIAILGYESVKPFLVGAACMAISALPALAARDVSPDFAAPPRHRFAAFILAVPAATFGAFVFAMGEQSGFAFLPLWGHHLGLEPALAALLASAMTLGNVVFQIPIGLIADRYDRRHVLLACGLVGSIGMGLAWAATEAVPILMAVLFIWGGATAGLYTVGLAHLASRFSGADLASANAAFIFCYALGMLVGPIAVGDSVARAPVSGFPLVLGTAFAAYTAIVGTRIALGRRTLAAKP